MQDVFTSITDITGIKTERVCVYPTGTKAGMLQEVTMAVSIKSAREIELMRQSARLLEDVFSGLEEAVRPGISTKEIDRLGEKLIRAHGCEPNFLNYNGYPASICVSVNDEVVHGIPHAAHILQEGDIVSLDAGLIYKGYHSDMARTLAWERFQKRQPG